MTRRRAATLAALAALGALAGPSAAPASWSEPQLASFNGAVQGSGFETAISGSGEHVVFSTAAYGLLAQPAPAGTYRVGGLVRRNLRTGAVDLAVPGRLYDAATDEPLDAGGGATPSLDREGSRLTFVTRDALVPGDDNAAADVYVRDLSRPWGADGAVTLASALDGSGQAIGWEPGSGGARLSQTGGTLSDDGRRVVFVTGGPAVLEPSGPVLPAGQVVVRDLVARTTKVMTTARGTAEPVGGARFATISGDGGTVAWVGSQGPAQAAFAAGEDGSPDLPWVFWRRVDGDPAAPALRPAATGDPDAPGCAADQPGGPACAGRFVLGLETAGFAAPVALSRDGLRVAFASTLRPADAVQLSELGNADAFVATMAPPRSVASAVRELTREGESASSIEESSPVVGVGLAGDGDTVAFTTARTRFRLSTPVFTGAPPTGGVDLETYVVDLPGETLELVTAGVGGSKAAGNGGGSDDLPKLSADGRRIAFTSAARNLVLGDVNGAPDSFTAERVTPPPAPPVAVQDVPPVVAGELPEPVYRLRARVSARRDGTLRVDAVVPGSGTLDVSLARAAAGASRGSLARTRRTSRLAGAVAVTLRPARSVRRAARRRAVRVTVTVRFTPLGGPFAGRRPLVRRLSAGLRVRSGR